MVEKRWRAVCERENEASAVDDSLKYTVFHLLPSDSELVSAFVERKRRYVFKYWIMLYNPIPENSVMGLKNIIKKNLPS